MIADSADEINADEIEHSIQPDTADDCEENSTKEDISVDDDESNEGACNNVSGLFIFSRQCFGLCQEYCCLI